MYEILGKQIPSEGFCTFYHCRPETKRNCWNGRNLPSYKYSADGSKIGILRIDLLPKYENEKMLKELLTLILEHIYEDFEVQAVLMKAQEYATARRNILKQFHFVAAMDECNISFRDYFIRF